MLNIALAGATGRMGLAITRELALLDGVRLVGAFGHAGGKHLGSDIGTLAGIEEMGVTVSLEPGAMDMDVLIDFSVPGAINKHVEWCRQLSAALLVGTTGLGAEENQMVSAASSDIAVLYAANTSVGINLCAALVETASRVLGESADIEIIEAHHRHKVDAPSGTALLLGEAAALPRDLNFPACGTFAREGHTGEREVGTIGFSTIRGGNIPGEHTVMFIGENERIEITHRVSDRAIFARGAVDAANWLAGQAPGLYSMQDMLDLH